MQKIPSFTIFNNEIFSKLTPKEKNILFYWSLFDPSTWEGVSTEETPRFMPNLLRGKKRVLSIIKRKSSFFKKQLKNKENSDKFYEIFAYGEFLTNYLLASMLEEIKKKRIDGRVDKFSLTKPVFPDIIFITNKNNKIAIEIKGMPAGTSNLKQRINNEIIKKFKNKKNKYSYLLLLLLFPVCLNEKPFRINSLIKGYYVYEDIIKNKIKCNVLCECVCENNLENYSLKNLTNKVIDNLVGFNKKYE